MKESQKQRIIKKLLRDGHISRNECLRNFITRLSARISDLEEAGWRFVTDNSNSDYKYTIEVCPLTRSVYKVGEKEITTYK